MALASAHFQTRVETGHPNVNKSAGIITNVSVISQGEARGHDLLVDAKTLAQVKACADRFGAGGVGVKFNKDTFDHGPGSMAGSLRNLRIVGQQLLGDFHILPSFSSRGYLLDLAANQPGSFGLSIDFDCYTEESGGKTFARCATLDAVTVVDVPAANRAGLFSAAFKKSTMNTEPIKTSTGFSRGIKTMMAAGESRASAILKLAQTHREGFNAWCAAGRPENDSSAQESKRDSKWARKGFNIVGQ